MNSNNILSNPPFEPILKKRYLKFVFMLICAGVINSCEDRSQKDLSSLPNNNILIDSLVTKGYRCYHDGDHLKSQHFFALADSLVTPQTDTTLRIQLLIEKTELKKEQALYESCLENYYEAARLSLLIQDLPRLGVAYFNISSTYCAMGQMDGGDKYNLLAQDIFLQTSDENRFMHCEIVNAQICSNRGDFFNAKKSLDTAIHFFKQEKDDLVLSMCLSNYGNLLLDEDEKKVHEAIEYYKEAALISQRLNNLYGLSIRFANIGDTYLSINELDEAKNYIDSSLSIAKVIDAKEISVNNLENLVQYYKKKKQPDRALEISDQLIALKTEIFQIESSNLILNIEEKFKVELEYTKSQNKILHLENDQLIVKKEQESTRLKMYFLIVLSIILISVSYIIYKKQKRIRSIDHQLHESEREFLASKAHLVETEKKQLENELDFKRKELMTFSISLEERERFLDQLKCIFLQISTDKIPEKEVLDDLKRLFYTRNKGNSEIYNKIEKINKSFHFKLKSNFPDLSEDDVRLASLVILDLSSKEISTLLTIEPKSVKMKRYRLKKKLCLNEKTELKEFLLAL